MHGNKPRPGRRARGPAVLLAVALVAAACGGGGETDTEKGGADDGADAGTPKRGGKLVYALESESTGGFCLPEATLALSGITVARAVYEPLMIPDDNGEMVPYLAESMTPNDTFDVWTIKLRPGVKFHDGSDLTAEVVKNNIDSFRGTFPNREPLLAAFVNDNVAETEAIDDLTLEVTTKTPWVAYPAYMFWQGRIGVMAQAQLDDQETCDRELIGTGPFRFKEWVVNDHLTVVRNDEYWREGYPYLDEIEFRPVIEAMQRVNGLESGEYDVIHTSAPLSIDELRQLEDAGRATLYESDQYAETNHTMFNVSKPPFDSYTARLAAILAIDRDAVTEIREKGIPQAATGPFAPGNMGYLDDTDFPVYDAERAKALVQQYEEETGQEFEFVYSVLSDPPAVETAQLLKQMWEESGIKVDLKLTPDLSQFINDAIGGNFQAQTWRLYAGGDPDTQWVWWYNDENSPNPVNFARFNDPEINELLRKGRAESDPEKRRPYYEEINREFAREAYNLWFSWTLWTVATRPEVRGVWGPENPDGSGAFPGLASGHPLLGIWIDE